MTIMKLVSGVSRQSYSALVEESVPFFVIALCIGVFVASIVNEFRHSPEPDPGEITRIALL